MQSHFDHHLKRARRRHDAALLLGAMGDAMLGAGAVLGIALVGQRAFAVPLVTHSTAAALAVLAIAWTLAAWLLGRPAKAGVALLLDERAALRERFSTTLALRGSTDPFAVAAREESYAKAAGLDVRRHFPIRPGRRWAHAAACWAAVGLAALTMPHLDLLGRGAEAKRLALEEGRARQAAAEVQRTAAKAETLVKQLNQPDLAADLARLAEFKPEAGAADIRREAIRAMGEVSDKLQQMASGERGQAASMMQQMLKQLRLPSQGLARKLSQALARGRFADAAEALKELQDRLARSDMTPQEQAAAAKDLENLARQLAAMSDQRKELEDALAAAGCDRGLAALSPDDLRKALEKAGLDAETIRKLMEKAQASRLAGQRCAALANALAACSGSGMPGGSLSPDGLAALGDQLSDLEAMRQELALARAAIDELYAGMASLGDGLGGMGLFAAGPPRPGTGSGGPGQGGAPVETSEGEPTNTLGTRVKGPSKPGPVIATWTTQEEQVRGEAKREFQEALQAGRDRAAEAVSENIIPSRYHESVKRYFETVGQPDAKNEGR